MKDCRRFWVCLENIVISFGKLRVEFWITFLDVRRTYWKNWRCFKNLWRMLGDLLVELRDDWKMCEEILWKYGKHIWDVCTTF